MSMVGTLSSMVDPFSPYHHHHYGHFQPHQQHMLSFPPPIQSPQQPFGHQYSPHAGPSSPMNGLISSSVRSPPASPSPPPARSPSNGSPQTQYDPSCYVALDCEFVGVGDQGLTSALARVSIVGFDGNVLLDTFCAPVEQVIDYRSWVSGVREPDLLGAPCFQVVQTRVQEILEGKVLVGHAVYNDLEVLGIPHPAPYTRDTALYEPLQKLACTSRPSLRALAKLVLSVDVQSGEHSSIEDARVTMAIFKAHQDAWETSLPFPAPSLMNEGFFTPSRPPLQPQQSSQGRPVPVVRFPSNASATPPNHFQQQQQQQFPPNNRMYSSQMQGSPPPPPIKMSINPMMDPRFSAAGLALPPPSNQTPANHMRRMSQQHVAQYSPQQMGQQQQAMQSPPFAFNGRQQEFLSRDNLSPRRVSSSPAMTINPVVSPSILNRSPSPSLSFDSTVASATSSEDNRQAVSHQLAQRYVVGMPKDLGEAKWDINGRKAKRRGGKRTRKDSFV